MTCTQCGHDMTLSLTSWLCFACGHTQSASSVPGSPEPAALAPAPLPPAPAEAPLPVLVPGSNLSATVSSSAPYSAPAEAFPPTPMPPVAAAPDSAPALGALPPATARPRHAKGKIAAIIAAAIFILAAAGSAAFLYMLAPQYALPSYLSRLVGAKTTIFSSAVSSESGEAYRFSLNLKGQNDLADLTKPKLDLDVTGQLSLGGDGLPGDVTGSSSLAGQFRLISQVAYFKIESFSLLSELLPIEISKDWYKYDLASAGKCLTNQKDSGSLLGMSVLTQVPVKDATFKGIDNLNGTPMLHFVGKVDNSKLKQSINDANKKLSADCQLDISENDYKNLAVTYEIWRGWSGDRVAFDIADSSSEMKFTVIMDTGSYNKPVKIEAPSGAKDASTLIGDFSGGTDASSDEDSESPRTNLPLSTTVNAQKAADTRRKTDILTIRRALEEYFVNNNLYPKTLAELTVAEAGGSAILPKPPVDPVNQSPFVYTYELGPADADGFANFTLRACLEYAGDTSNSVNDPVAPCKTATFEVVGQN